MANQTLLDQIGIYRQERIASLVAAKTAITAEQRREIGKKLNELLGRATTGEEQLAVDNARQLLSQIPRAEEGQAADSGASADYA